MKFETWWSKVLTEANARKSAHGGPLTKLLSELARATLRGDKEVVEAFELHVDRSPWTLELKDSLTGAMECKGGTGTIQYIECHENWVIPRLVVELEPDESALAIHAIYNGGPVPDLSKVNPRSKRVQDWIVFTAIAAYPRFMEAVKRSWGADEMLSVADSRSSEGSTE